MNPQLKNKLVWNAVPSIFDVPNPPAPVTTKRPLPRKRSLEGQEGQTTYKKMKGILYYDM